MSAFHPSPPSVSSLAFRSGFAATMEVNGVTLEVDPEVVGAGAFIGSASTSTPFEFLYFPPVEISVQLPGSALSV